MEVLFSLLGEIEDFAGLVNDTKLRGLGDHLAIQSSAWNYAGNIPRRV